jgi:nitroreductase
MNPVTECIKNRRSCRNFKADRLKDEDLAVIIEAGLWAPSGNNKQPWFFTVLQNMEKISEMNSEAKKNALKYLTDPKRLSVANNPDFDLFYKAPCLIVVSADMSSGTAVADCSAAIQNMMLAADSIGVASLWNGIIKRFWFDTDGVTEFKKKYKIPEEYTPLYAVAFGYAAKEKNSAPERRKNLVKYIY